jgi:hypothetical protein
VTSTAEKLAARAEDLPEGSFRRRVLEGARHFKAAWVDLGRLLSQVKRDQLWREWGHPSFERYCAKELFIRGATAEKLTASYLFLERHEPEIVRPRSDTRAPPFEVIEVLSRAEAAGRLSAEGWRELRDEVLEDRAPTVASVNRRLVEKLGPAPAPPPARKAERLAKLAALARRLATACREEGAVPRALAQRADDLAGDLESLGGGGTGAPS